MPLIPGDEVCQRVIKEMLDWEEDQLTEWEREFAESNETRLHFTDKQKEIIQGFLRKYHFPWA